MYYIAKTFSTRDGRWDRQEQEYDVGAANAAKYGTDAFKSKGCATCLFGRIEGGPGDHIRFEVPGGPKEIAPADDDGWANIPLFHSSAYNPDRGELGPWTMQVEGYPSEVAAGLGLPFSWHVSTFVVFTWKEDGVPPVPDDGDTDEGPTPPVEGPENWVQLFIDGILVYERGKPDGST